MMETVKKEADDTASDKGEGPFEISERRKRWKNTESADGKAGRAGQLEIDSGAEEREEKVEEPMGNDLADESADGKGGRARQLNTIVSVSGGELDDEDKQKYIDYAWQKYGREPSEMIIWLDKDVADLAIYFKHVPFERIGRLDDWRGKEMEKREEERRKMFFIENDENKNGEDE